MHTPKYVGPEYQTNPLAAIAAGKTGTPQIIAVGGDKGIGKIVFGGNLAAGDTVSVNGTTFTAVASGAAGNQFNVDVSLTLTLDALVTVLNASVVAGVALATYTKTDANTALTATMDLCLTAYNGTGFPLAATVVAGKTVTAVAGGVDTPSISLDTESAELTIASGTKFVDLPAGDDFQRKTIYASGAGTVNVAGNFASTNVQAQFTAGDLLDLICIGGEWKTLVNTGVTLS